VDVKESMAKARAVGLDLVEVDPHSRPPVCRIMDYGKWKYAQRKKEQKSKGRRHETELKEIRIKTPKIGDHDLEIKIVHAKDFLSRGDRVQFTLRFRGRELAHVDEGKKIFAKIKADLAEVAKVEQDFRYEGKRITMLLAQAGKKVETGAAPASAAAPAQVSTPAPAVAAAPKSPA
jgi:translation initiation factor IF-3